MRPVLKQSLLGILDASCVAAVPLLLLLRLVFWLPRRFLRISIWTGQPILTLPRKCAAERRLGFRSVTVVSASYYITNDFDTVLSRVALGQRYLMALTRYLSLWVACIVAEQVHAFMDGGLLPPLEGRQFRPVELMLYRWLRIRLFLWTYGGDVRVRTQTLALGRPNCCTDCTQVGIACVCHADAARTNLHRVAATAKAIFAMGDMAEYTGQSRNDLYFWPIDLEQENGQRYRPAYPIGKSDSPLRVVHAPNHREFKGTRYLEEAVARLRRQGLPIDLIMVEKVSNAEALQIYRTADVIFDQCLIGFHGYFAIEAMALGKPVMCFIRKPNEYLLAPDECPIINTHVTTLADDLAALVERRGDLPGIGRRGREYVEKYFTIDAFSTRLRKAYEEMGVL